MLTSSRFHNFCDLVYQNLGIAIDEKNKDIFHIKLQKVMRYSDITSFDEYYRLLSNPNRPELFQQFVNIITTNTTEFFREQAHFKYIMERLPEILKGNPRIEQNKELRIWCAGCSSGQEPVSLAIVLKEALDPGIQTRILATDISSKVLSKAVSGQYDEQECEGIPTYFRIKYFDKTKRRYHVKDGIKQMITYRSFNLMDDFQFTKHFDMIFCRNVMIYFSFQVQQKLINKFYDQLVPGGLFFVGHSESLHNKMHFYQNKAPSVYLK